MSKQVSVRYLMALAWPAILEQLLLTMATYVDTAMIGALGYRATAAVAVRLFACSTRRSSSSRRNSV